MKPALVLAPLLCGLLGCSSVEFATVSREEVAANGEAVAVVQATSVGFTAFFHLVEFVQADLDTTVNKLLVSEAKAMGGSRVELLKAETTPRHGIFALPALLLWFPTAQATGVVLR